MTLRPLHDRVLLKRLSPEEKTTGGLFIPTKAQEKSQFAEVVAVGTGRRLDSGEVIPLKVEPGMTVLLSKWAGDEVELEGEKHLILKESDILAAAF